MVRRRKIRIHGDVSTSIDEMLTRKPIQAAPFTFTVAAQAGQLTLPQSDVGDIFIAATPCVYNLTLVTADAQLLDCPWLKTLSSE